MLEFDRQSAGRRAWDRDAADATAADILAAVGIPVVVEAIRAGDSNRAASLTKRTARSGR